MAPAFACSPTSEPARSRLAWTGGLSALPAPWADTRGSIDLVEAVGRRTAMRAEAGDELVVRGRHVGDADHEG